MDLQGLQDYINTLFIILIIIGIISIIALIIFFRDVQTVGLNLKKYKKQRH